jgi:hypothetical protein
LGVLLLHILNFPVKLYQLVVELNALLLIIPTRREIRISTEASGGKRRRERNRTKSQLEGLVPSTTKPPHRSSSCSASRSCKNLLP